MIDEVLKLVVRETDRTRERACKVNKIGKETEKEKEGVKIQKGRVSIRGKLI